MKSKKLSYGPINPSFPHVLHGGDYNPDQWIKTPEIWEEDIRLMQLANCNAMSIGIFSWSALEPEEGLYEFGWLDTIMNKLASINAAAILATPSGARPAWMSERYPEVLRVSENRHRNLHGTRHNHCYTSPVYRAKTQNINRMLAERYKDHPALILWHLSNEYGGECHCDLCQTAFREWLKKRYNEDIEALNQAWWAGFWSHAYNNFEQIESPASHGEHLVHAHNLDWKRFVTYQTIDFMKNEIAPLKEITPSVPVTTNMMGTYPGLDYWKMAKQLDVISWDSYPAWHTNSKKTWQLASDIAFVHDINRCLLGGKPFMLMESTPSIVNWQAVNKLKRPNMNILSSLQAVAHGSDTVQYFQWRKSRGSCEKFHGAVVDHVGHENTRVFKEVARLGEKLGLLDEIIGSTVRPDVAVIYDWENRWAIEDAKGFHNDQGRKGYEEACKQHYQSFWRLGVPVDVIDSECDFAGYKLIAAPMLYMLKPGVADRLASFVENGGTLITTYLTGYVNESDLCFLGGFPGPLSKLVGIWSEELDSLHDTDTNGIRILSNAGLNMSGSWKVKNYCELIHAKTAQVVAEYTDDFYSGEAAVTVNDYGGGKAWHIAARTEPAFLHEFYAKLSDKLDLLRSLGSDLPEGVSAQLRTDGENEFVFLMNFSEEEQTVNLRSSGYDMLDEKEVSGAIPLNVYEVKVLKFCVDKM